MIRCNYIISYGISKLQDASWFLSQNVTAIRWAHSHKIVINIVDNASVERM